jgi:hypothetical protein
MLYSIIQKYRILHQECKLTCHPYRRVLVNIKIVWYYQPPSAPQVLIYCGCNDIFSNGNAYFRSIRCCSFAFLVYDQCYSHDDFPCILDTQYNFRHRILNAIKCKTKPGFRNFKNLKKCVL